MAQVATAAPEILPEVHQPLLIPPLENGSHLGATEFLRRYEATPELKKAELINGIVFSMASPVRTDLHGDPDSLIQGWLLTYSAATPGTRSSTNATVRLGPDDVMQPDATLRLLPEHGGRAKLDHKGYLQGPPELVVEIAASSASIDTHEKLISYRRAGVREYLVWRTEERAVDWWSLQDDEFRPLPRGVGGLLKSTLFPGLHLSVPALLAFDAAALLAALHAGLASAEHATFLASLRPPAP